MLKKLYQDISEEHNLRADLIALKKELKKEGSKQAFCSMIDGEPYVFIELLKHSEAKVRKNAALVLGELNLAASLEPLFLAYKEETQLFIRSDYLKAMANMDYGPYLLQLQDRLKELVKMQPKENEKKHIWEETTLLQKLILQKRGAPKHLFIGIEEEFEIILTTNRLFREVTARQIPDTKINLIPAGVKAITRNLDHIKEIRTYKELLFTLNCDKKLTEDPQEIARELANSNLLFILRKAYGEQEQFYFRIGIHGAMPLDKRSMFLKRCSFALEELTNRKLVNTASDYEIELRLIQGRDDTFYPVLKLHTLEDNRFSYRKNVVAASIQPSLAALIIKLSAPYLKADARVLDPFCGVGTMLIEREIQKPAKTMYGIDILEEAIDKAKENTMLARETIVPTQEGITSICQQIYYTNRDCFRFAQEYLFDEIITNMPARGKKSRNWQDSLYENFFTMADRMLAEEAIIILYSDEMGLVKKHLRLNKGFILEEEYCLNEKEGFYLFIIRKKDII
ncbi:hypothetical protein LQZ18_01225 [Lachnospiraceae bacterium ZAX-1]